MVMSLLEMIFVDIFVVMLVLLWKEIKNMIVNLIILLVMIVYLEFPRGIFKWKIHNTYH